MDLQAIDVLYAASFKAHVSGLYVEWTNDAQQQASAASRRQLARQWTQEAHRRVIDRNAGTIVNTFDQLGYSGEWSKIRIRNYPGYALVSPVNVTPLAAAALPAKIPDKIAPPRAVHVRHMNAAPTVVEERSRPPSASQRALAQSAGTGPRITEWFTRASAKSAAPAASDRSKLKKVTRNAQNSENLWRRKNSKAKRIVFLLLFLL